MHFHYILPRQDGVEQQQDESTVTGDDTTLLRGSTTLSVVSATDVSSKSICDFAALC